MKDGVSMESLQELIFKYHGFIQLMRLHGCDKLVERLTDELAAMVKKLDEMEKRVGGTK